jgi:outer membrane receptor protein involved in Fe transport
MKTQNPLPFRKLCWVSGLLALPAIQAQELPEDVYTLPEFVTKTSELSDYLASESVTGTRVATKIEDLPFTVNVVTSEFLDDFNLIEYKDQFSYVSNVGQAEGQSPGYTLRGFTADVQLRNGFRRIGLIDKVNVDRVEVIKGPAASIYGAVLPGGAVNVITKTPKRKPEYRLRTTVGNYDLIRGELSATGPIGKVENNLQYRFDGAYYTRSFETEYREQNQQTGALQLAWQPSVNTNVLVELEYLKRDEPSNTSVTIPFVTERRRNPYFAASNPNTSRTYTHYIAIANEDRTYTVTDEAFWGGGIETGAQFDLPDLTYVTTQGPETYANRDIKSVGVTFEHRINEVFSFRTGANAFERDLTRIEVGARDQLNPTTGKVQRGTGRARFFPETGQGWQSDLLASFRTGGIQHKLLVTLDYQRATDAQRQYDAAKNDAFPGSVTSGLDMRQPDYGFVTYDEDPSLYTPATGSCTDNVLTTRGIFVSERATMFEDKLNLMAGVRFDEVKTMLQTYGRNGSTLFKADREEESDDQITYQLGLNYEPIDGLTLFASTSTSFQPQLGAGNRLNADATDFESFILPNEIGKGIEGGLKLSLLKETLSMTLSYFDIRREDVAGSNVSVTLSDPAPGVTNPQSITDLGVETSKGYEFDFSWVASKQLQFFGAYGYNDGRIEESNVAHYRIGDRLRRAPKHNAGLAAKYEFTDGSLKGLSFNVGLRYTGDSQANSSGAVTITPSNVSESNQFTNLRMANGLLPFAEFEEGAVLSSIPRTVLVSNGRGSVYNEAYFAVDAGVGYRWESGKLRHRVQLNLTNLTDEKYTYGSSAPGDPIMGSMTYDLRF